jgi:hypothetical protein
MLPMEVETTTMPDSESFKMIQTTGRPWSKSNTGRCCMVKGFGV